ncbi:hypothetical protein OAU36_05305 [Gammaproteobacteria bacterium]|jgi:hypothetical protein|nr:hypothetical protein [Gammaproteobacteria bacterium]MDG1026008.1 hypothetical protein [Gammaproteobacteria bacterium]MDG2339518.1 hypothetical protein [Gammaproteobacteria bacterium]
MTLRNYLILCAAGSVLTVLILLLVPSVGESIEAFLIAFLSTNAN